jgi:hypothetical protein
MQKPHNPSGRVLARALAQELKRVEGGGDVIVTNPPGQLRDITQQSQGDVPAD